MNKQKRGTGFSMRYLTGLACFAVSIVVIMTGSPDLKIGALVGFMGGLAATLLHDEHETEKVKHDADQG